MPHLILDFARPLSKTPAFAGICTRMAKVMCAQPAFPNPGAIKVRAMVWDHYCGGVGRADFIHATVRLLPGRDAQTKSDISHAIWQALRAEFPDTQNLTVEIAEMDGPSYTKEPRDG